MKKVAETGYRSTKAYALLCLLGFIVLGVVSATPFAESVDNIAVYVGLPILVILSVVTLQQWWKRQIKGDTEHADSGWIERIATKLKNLPPFF